MCQIFISEREAEHQTIPKISSFSEILNLESFGNSSDGNNLVPFHFWWRETILKGKYISKYFVTGCCKTILKYCPDITFCESRKYKERFSMIWTLHFLFWVSAFFASFFYPCSLLSLFHHATIDFEAAHLIKYSLMTIRLRGQSKSCNKIGSLSMTLCTVGLQLRLGFCL